MKRLLGAIIAAGLCAGAAPAVAAPPDSACTITSLDAQAPLNGGSQSTTLQGSGTCVVGGAPRATTFAVSGTAAVNSCSSQPYIDINGTLTVSISGAAAYSTGIDIPIEATPGGEQESYAQLSTSDHHYGVLHAHFTSDDGAIGLLSRCAGGRFQLTMSGGMAADPRDNVTVCAFYGWPDLHRSSRWSVPSPIGDSGTFAIRADAFDYIECASKHGQQAGPEGISGVQWSGTYQDEFCGTGTMDGTLTVPGHSVNFSAALHAQLIDETALLTTPGDPTPPWPWSGIVQLVPITPAEPVGTPGCWRDYNLYGVIVEDVPGPQ